VYVSDLLRAKADRTRGEHLHKVGRRADRHLMASARQVVLPDEAQHRVNPRGVRPDQLGDCQSGVGGGGDGSLAGVTVLMQVAAVQGDPASPILGVDDEHAARTNDYVVHVRPLTAGPPHVVQRRPGQWEQGQNLGSCDLPVGSRVVQLRAVSPSPEPQCGQNRAPFTSSDPQAMQNAGAAGRVSFLSMVMVPPHSRPENGEEVPRAHSPAMP
jgi:hypothetical protein